MTRETKIGLLFGLAVIVVFAMLLSHTGTVPPPGDGVHVVRSGPEPVALARNERAMEPGPAPSNQPAPGAPTTRPLMPLGNVLQLPRPTELEMNTPGHEYVDAGTAGHPTWTERPSALMEGLRVAPPLPVIPLAEPEPTPRVNVPERSPEPEPARPAPDPVAPTPPTPREYIVKQGETLGQIARSIYGSGPPLGKLMEHLVEANKGQIRNKDSILEGQKLLIPELPAELFEPVTNLNVAQSEARTARLEELINAPVSPPRQAPALSEADRPAAGRDESAVRLYEVKRGDNFSSIARQELGSEGLWKRIQELNKDVDPKRMQPGMKIKLPAKRPAAGAMASGQLVASR